VLSDLWQLQMYANGQWRWHSPEVSGRSPSRTKHTCSVLRGFLFVVGGHDGKQRHSDVFVYSIRKEQWSKPSVQGTSPPKGMSSHATVLVGDSTRLFVMGTAAGSMQKNACNCYCFDAWHDVR
jgi:dynein heavy chain